MDSIATTDLSSPLEAVRYSVGSHIGKRREENQDSFGVMCTELFKAFVVADGMGGVKGGALASSIAVRTIEQVLGQVQEISEQTIKDAVGAANRAIFARGMTDSGVQGMGTTICGLVFTETKMFIFNVGDSRVYRLREGKIVRLTTDHTLVQELLRTGAISSAQASSSPVSHMLTRSLGPTAEVEVDCIKAPDGPARGDVYLLCSDGLYNTSNDRQLREIIEGYRLDDAVEQLIENANRKGGADNITALLVEIDQLYPAGPEEFPNLDYGGDSDGSASALGKEALGTAKHDELLNDEAQAEARNPSIHARAKIDPSLFQAARTVVEASDYEQQVRAAAASAAPDRRRMLYFIGAFLGGVIATVLLFFVSGTDEIEVSKTGATESSIVPSQIAAGAIEVPAGPVDVPVADTAPVVQHGSTPNVADVPEVSSGAGFSSFDRTRVERRGEYLRGLIKKIEVLSALFESSVAIDPVSEIAAAEKSKREAVERIAAVRDSIDAETRKLSIWYSRRKRLEEGTDVSNIASEVAGVSDSVREAKAAFERTTWEYLRELESLRYNPNDEAQGKKVSDLVSARNTRLAELRRAVDQSIQQSISEANEQLTDFTIQRDGLEGERENIDRILSSLNVLKSGTPEARDAKRAELAHRREAALAELAEIDKALGSQNSPH